MGITPAILECETNICLKLSVSTSLDCTLVRVFCEVLLRVCAVSIIYLPIIAAMIVLTLDLHVMRICVCFFCRM